MTYTVGIPQDGQSLGNSKPQVRANFSDLFTYLSNNHYALNATNAGKHKFIEMPNETNKVTVADECAIYGQDLGPTPFSNMVWQQESGGADPLRNQGAIVQMTNIRPTNASQGSSFLPGGIWMTWGTMLSGQTTFVGGVGSTTFNYLLGGEGFTLAGVAAIPWVAFATQLNVVNTGYNSALGTYTTTTIRLATSGIPQNTPFNYLIIGPKT